ncbi:LysR family transcriptional regulator [Methyloversatilis sp. XJ19-13]|uniref:LysR family transcriptional regulator n=1 Tax=Methyloversatilis sp. XJ19-13 TaxID=2963430 RepID=UPI00211C28DF|nr:LysR family transcriptional regulator [Methyloversatilis sp. XJ19-13]MCQ9375348.1 LysR family transcriptional regulator [Methyloversatilis sp. XJ19-13]
MDRLDELRLLVEVADTGSLAAAARRMHCSAAAATRLLNAMEARLGARLVERTTRRSVPTEAGRRLVEQARKLLQGYRDATDAATGDAVCLTGTLRMGAPLVFGRRYVAPVIADFLSAHADLRVELQLSNALADLRDGGLDVALRIGTAGDAELVARQLGSVRHVLVGSPGYFERAGRPRDVDQLAGHALLALTHVDGVRDWVFAQPGGAWRTLKPQARFVVNQAETVIEAACAGQGIARVLSYQVVGDIEAGRLERVLGDCEPTPQPVNLVYPGRRFLPQRVRRFVDFAIDALRDGPAFRLPP